MQILMISIAVFSQAKKLNKPVSLILSRRMTMVAMFVLLHANPVKENVVKRSFDKFAHLGEDAIKSLMELKGDKGFSASEIHNSSPMKETSLTSRLHDIGSTKETLMASKADDAFSAMIFLTPS